MVQGLEDIRTSTILVVDGEAARGEAIVDAFLAAGFSEVLFALDREQAQDLLGSREIDAVVYTLTANDESSVVEPERLLDLGEHVDKRFPLVVVCEAGAGLQVESLAAGAQDYLEYPFEPAELVRRVSKLVELHVLYQQVCHENEMLRRMVSEQMKQLQSARVAMLRSAAGDDLGVQSILKALRMSQSCYILAQAMGLDAATCDQVRLASPMQDIGSIAIPDRILQKSGALSHEEREIIKMHVFAGDDILADQKGEVGAMARLIARHHHERWDGSGYPEGLVGENIPLVARIAAICDVFDALTTDRPHKTAWPVEDAVHEIEKRSGVHFDPSIVPVFLEAVPEVLASRAEE
jgi:putative two-component system response regulator